MGTMKGAHIGVPIHTPQPKGNNTMNTIKIHVYRFENGPKLGKKTFRDEECALRYAIRMERQGYYIEIQTPNVETAP